MTSLEVAVRASMELQDTPALLCTTLHRPGQSKNLQCPNSTLERVLRLKRMPLMQCKNL